MRRATLVPVLALCLASCAGGGAWPLLLTVGLLLAAACAEEATQPIGSRPDAELSPDMGDGRWERCCVDGGVSQCWCPGGFSCNYAWTCNDGGIPDTGAVDTGLPDTGEPGTWERCCEDGMVSWCFCPEGTACNYGQYEDCGDGTCTFPGLGSCGG